jgi:hypothetical protein
VRKVKIVFLTTLALAIFISFTYYLLDYLRPLSAGLRVESEPVSSVYVDTEYVGKTPVRITRSPSEVVIKLVPDTFDHPLSPYETKVLLTGGVDTVVRREFSPNDEEAAGEILSFEKGVKGETGLAIVTIPDAAQISINGEIKGFTPFKINDITPGEHLLVLSAPGYLDRSIKLRTRAGYSLTAFISLAVGIVDNESKEPPGEAVEDEETEAEVKIEVLPTTTGYLRVRKEPTTTSEEVGRVQPGKQYLLVEEKEDTNWFKIVYQDDKEGWVSGQYVKKASSATPTPAVSPGVTPAN